MTKGRARGKQLKISKYKGRLVKTVMSGGREYDMEADRDGWLKNINPFLLDEMKIEKSDALGRLSGKMQVISTPRNNHISNRRSHTDEVIALAILIAHIFDLNIDLCRAIALGHDVGHSPFGPHGNEILGISHSLNGVIILLYVENLNLTKEVILGILYHSLNKNNLNNGKKLSNEAYVVALADKFAYLPKDFEDFKRAGMLKGLILPEELSMFKFGEEDFPRKMQEICINALIKESLQEGRVSFSKSEIAIAFQKIRAWAYDNIYKKLNDMSDRAYHKTNLALVLKYFIEKGLAEDLSPEFVISMMTDGDVNFLAGMLKKEYLTPDEEKQIRQLSIFEIIRSLKNKKIDHAKIPPWLKL